MTETELIISEMSQVTLSDDLLKQVNMKELIEEFQSNDKKLGDFQKTRDAYEKRGFRKKIWDVISFDNTMENAQLSATEVQAKFSKTLGQLMVVNVALSRHLHQQQEQLAIQQGIIKNQTEQIELQTHEIEKQHEVLAKQNSDLEKLVNDYFELRGLTQDGAKKLISIANEIQHTRDDLLESMEKSRNWIAEQQQKILTEISLQIASFDEATQENVAEVTRRCDVIESDSGHLSQKLSEINMIFIDKYEAINTALSIERDSLDTHTRNNEKSFTNLTNNFNSTQEEFNLFREKQQKSIEKLTIIFSVISMALGGTVTYLLFT